jgi:hypothetical protein
MKTKTLKRNRNKKKDPVVMRARKKARKVAAKEKGF